MKKLLGILAVVALLAVPVMAQSNVPVTINVASYVGLTVPPGSLVMAVTDPVASATVGVGVHQAETTFQVQGNVAMRLNLTASELSPSTSVVNGQEGALGDPWPTARLGGSPAAAGIGYGPSLFNVTAGTSDGFTPVTEQDCRLAFAAGLSDGRIRINSYLDSGRSTIVGLSGQLAPPGAYTGALTLTVSVGP